MQHCITEFKTSEMVMSANGPMRLLHVTQVSRGHAVAQLVETLRYKSEGRGFDS